MCSRDATDITSGKHTCISISHPTVLLQRPVREDQKGDYIVGWPTQNGSFCSELGCQVVKILEWETSFFVFALLDNLLRNLLNPVRLQVLS